MSAVPRKRKTDKEVYCLAYFNLWWNRMEREAVRTIKDRVMEAERGKQEMSLRGMLTTIESDTALEMDLDSMLMKENSTKMMDCGLDNLNEPQHLKIPEYRDDNLLGIFSNASGGKQEHLRGANNVDSGGGMALSENRTVSFEQPQDFGTYYVSFGQHQADDNFTQHFANFDVDNTGFTGGDYGLVEDKQF